jgi:hypothetical protein
MRDELPPNHRANAVPHQTPAAATGSTGRIIAMSRFRQDMRDPALRLVDAYWSDLRAQAKGDVPARSDVDPRGLESVLDRVFILERIAPGFARIRLSGCRLTEIAGVETRGLPLSALFVPEARDRLAQLLIRLFSGPATVTLDISAKPKVAGTEIAAQMLLLPLRDNGGRISRAIGALSDVGSTRLTKPRRFEIETVNLHEISLPNHWRAGEEQGSDRVHRAFAEEAEPLLRPGPRLRVIEGGEAD